MIDDLSIVSFISVIKSVNGNTDSPLEHNKYDPELTLLVKLSHHNMKSSAYIHIALVNK